MAAPFEQISKTLATLTLGAVMLPVSMALDGATPLVTVVHLSAGILNSAVTLAAAFAPNTHPASPVLVAFAVPANLKPVTWENPAEGPLPARAGTAPLTASSRDPSTAMVAPTLRSIRTGAPLLSCPGGPAPQSSITTRAGSTPQSTKAAAAAGRAPGRPGGRARDPFPPRFVLLWIPYRGKVVRLPRIARSCSCCDAPGACLASRLSPPPTHLRCRRTRTCRASSSSRGQLS